MSDSDVVIRVEGLGKKYALHHEKSERYIALRDVVARQARAAGRLLNPFTLAGQLRRAQRQAAQERAASEEEFWALKDVSFEIRRGERVGIIGRNGAGKSTLLKILSRITEPTTGRVEIRGRVASLLEVGTGFHPELTGRENIYLNGAILGMTRREIRSKFDEIVDFAEVEKFLDTPVKRYSSGMYVRLAFAVAAHLEPEILVVDEVLAVGDASFQKKCLGKMEDVADRDGRTVLFVSHQMSAINKLTLNCLYLELGRVRRFGVTSEVVADYMSFDYSSSGRFPSFINAKNAKERKGACLVSIRVQTSSGGVIHEASKPLAILFEISLECARPGRTISFQVVNQYGWPVTHIWIYDEENKCLRGEGLTELSCVIPSPRLNVGDYSLNVYLGGRPNEPLSDSASEICHFQISNTLKTTPFGWRESACCYHEEALWLESGVEVKASPSVASRP
ncbi:polysaccharide ABC transporter ATP-binding protein [Vulcanococcus limneticus]|uniref:ABC transporter ATP-binding protein n=1 Tax=Vulcanococcus limneticus TaxID=2170428 RepID=UPI00398C17DA